jgi:hypothetical protein
MDKKIVLKKEWTHTEIVEAQSPTIAECAERGKKNAEEFAKKKS